MALNSIAFSSGPNGTHYYHQWQPAAPIAWLHIMHGMTEHSARYADLAQYLNQQGIMVTAGDHRGHGRTGEAMGSLYHMGDSDSWNQMVDDQWQLINHIAAEQDLPLIIMGHSMGSFMATRFCQQYGQQLRQLNNALLGLVLSGSNYDSPTTFKIAAGLARIERARVGAGNTSSLLEQLSFGSFNRAFKPTRTEKDWLSSDNTVVDSYIADPWCGGAISTQSWYDFLNGLAQLSQPKAMAQLDSAVPVYLFAGDLDPVGGNGKGVEKLRQALLAAGVLQVDMQLYKDGRHEMLNEHNKQQVYQDLAHWISRRLQH
jgi:alpha-beta hydrolase superfamily lysophospholipase